MTVREEVSTMSQTIGTTVAEAVFARLQQLQPTQTNVQQQTHQTSNQQQANTTPVNLTPSKTNNESPTAYNNNQIQALIKKLNTNQGSSKPLFTSYNKNTDIMKWKSLCVLALTSNKSKHYNSFLTWSNDETRTFDPQMSGEKRIQLFHMTYQSLDPAKLNLEFITQQMIEEGDGLKLWEKLESRFSTTHKSNFDKDELRNEFKTMTKGSNESNEGFLSRVEKKLTTLHQHHIYPTPVEQAVVLLEGMKSTHLNEAIVQLRTGESSAYSSWIWDGDLKHTMDKANNHIKVYRRIVEKNESNNYRKALLNNNMKKTETEAPRSTPTYMGSKGDEKPFVKRSDKLKQALTDLTDKVKTLLKWMAKKKSGCALHPSVDNHVFAECNHVRNICAELGLIDELATAIAEYNAGKVRGADPDGGGANARRTITSEQLQEMVRAKRATQQSARTDNANEEEEDYDTGSQDTSSTNNDNYNAPSDPYIVTSSIPIQSRCKLTSILRENKHHPTSPPTPSPKKVTFSPIVTQQQLLKSNENVKYIPTSNGNNTATSTENEEEAVADSGATNDMSGNKLIFEKIIKLKPRKYVTLGDETTTLPIEGYGFMNYTLNDKRMRKIGYYVPGLGTTLISIKQHIKYQGCYFHAENNTVLLAYPKAVLYATTDPEFAL